MKYATQELILHDGSMKNGVSFITIFACHIRKVYTLVASGVIEEQHMFFLFFLSIH